MCGNDSRIRRAATAPVFLLLASLCGTAAGQSGAHDLPLFRDDSTLQLTLEAPLRELRRSARTRENFDAALRYTDADGNPVSLELRLRVRGNSRLEQCDFPPLRLDFKRDQLEGTLFEGQNRLKLVTLCRRQNRYRDYLALEYDIYRLFNALTDRSFRVRRTNIEFVGTDSRREEVFTEPAFLIEEDWEVAARHASEALEITQLEVAELDARHTALVGIFQYMIGNTDWSALRGPDEDTCCHNGKLFGRADGTAVFLPYDFDQAGLIDTEYSSPSERLPIRAVTQRLYRGYCAHNAQVEDAIALVLDRRSALDAVIDASAASAAAKQDALEFLHGSLEILADPQERAEEILDACRG